MEKETTAIVRTISWVMLLSFFLEEVKIRLRSGTVTIQERNTTHLENVPTCFSTKYEPYVYCHPIKFKFS